MNKAFNYHTFQNLQGSRLSIEVDNCGNNPCIKHLFKECGRTEGENLHIYSKNVSFKIKNWNAADKEGKEGPIEMEGEAPGA